MIFELRTYDLKPGKAPVYLEFFRTFGVGLVTRHLPMGGYWMVESGRLNRIEHLWIYDSFAERDACRAGLAQEREWVETFIPRAFADVVAQQNRIMALERGSDAVEQVIAARRNRHDNQPAGSAMFAAGLHGLSFSAGPLPGAPLAAFRVLSGEAPGTHVTLQAGDFDALTADTGGLAAHELLRPLSLSPLR